MTISSAPSSALYPAQIPQPLPWSPDYRISVALVDDQVEVCETVRELLSLSGRIEFLGFALEAGAFRDLVGRQPPHIAVLDLALGGPENGLALLDWLRERHPKVRPIVLTGNPAEIGPCYLAGARGFVLKQDLIGLEDVVQAVHAGQLVIPPAVGEAWVGQMRGERRRADLRERLRPLTDREMEVLRCLHRSGSREKAADTLALSFYTIRRHIQNILDKLGETSFRQVLARYGEVLD